MTLHYHWYGQERPRKSRKDMVITALAIICTIAAALAIISRALDTYETMETAIDTMEVNDGQN